MLYVWGLCPSDKTTIQIVTQNVLCVYVKGSRFGCPVSVLAWSRATIAQCTHIEHGIKINFIFRSFILLLCCICLYQKHINNAKQRYEHYGLD